MSNTGSMNQAEVSSYLSLYRQVKEVLLEGQRRIEAERVRTYWEAGRLIREHLLSNTSRAEYGRAVFSRLAQDLTVSKDLLHRCVKFHQTYPDYEKVVARPQLSWTHFKKLITVPDEEERNQIAELAERRSWSTDELAERIKAGRQEEAPAEAEEEFDTQIEVPYQNSVAVDTSATLEMEEPLTPVRGEIYTYRLARPKVLVPSAQSNLVVDLGFATYREVDARLVSAFAQEDIVESRFIDGNYRFFNTDRSEKELYTYQACVERVLDGDTLKVHVDLGFGTWTRQTVRLRGIDAPELGSRAGESAKAFLQSLLKESDLLVLRSSRSDKYDRYLVDVFLPKGAEFDPLTDIFLNNLLLEKGHAVRWAE